MAKGASFERQVAKALSLWWTYGDDDNVFWRTQTSGARATIRHKAGKSTAGQEGDIVATNPIGKPLTDFISIEVKKGYKWEFDDFISTKQQLPLMIKFINQAKRECEQGGKSYWFLIAKRDRKETLLFMEQELYLGLATTTNLTTIPKCEIYLPNTPSIMAIRFEDFINLVKPIDIKYLSETWRKTQNINTLQ